MADWFRSSDWSDDGQRDFEARLSRSRAWSRPQYLRTKAVALQNAGELPGAMSLLQRIIEEHADAWTEVAFAHERLGDVFRARGDLAGAATEYRAAVAVSPSSSGTTGEVHVKLAEVLLESSTAPVAEIERALTAAKSHVTFNSTAFRVNVLEARLAQTTGELDRRRRAAMAALDLVGTDPQFDRHPTVGLVHAAPPLVAELERLARKP